MTRSDRTLRVGSVSVKGAGVPRGRRNGHASANGNGVGTVRELSKGEILKLIDARAQLLLGISGKEFMTRYQRGELNDAPSEEPIRVLAALVAKPPR